MPIGCFLVEVDSKSKATITQMFFEDEDEKVEIDDNILLQMRMGLTDKRLYTLLLPNFSVMSYIAEFKRGKESFNLITSIILRSSDDPNNFRDSIKMVSDFFIKNIDLPPNKIADELEISYHDYFETGSIILSQKDLTKRLAEKVKSLNKVGKFDEAKKLLDIIKKSPKKLYQANKNGEKAIKNKDYDKAEREFLKAVKYAEDLQEDELVASLKDKAKIVKQIPKLIVQRDKAVDKAKDAMRNDRFDHAYKFFKEAADLSVKLLDPNAVEEYKLKADALAKYNEVHKRFHKD